MNLFDKLSGFQYKHAGTVLIITLIFTLLVGVFGVTKVAMESDLSKMYPQDLEIFKLADKVNDNFGSSDASFILIRIEDGKKGGVYDIRDPKVIEFVTDIQKNLEEEEMVEDVKSLGMIFEQMAIPSTLEQSKLILSNVPGADNFFNDDYSSTIIMINSDFGRGEEKIKELDERTKEIVSEAAKPDGVEVYITGTPQIRIMILDLLVKDAIFTLGLAGVIIFALLIVMQKSFTKAFLIFSPLAFGLFWTLGIMGLLGIKLSIATVGIGAMILGLGIEYGVFIVSRYHEERNGKSSMESLRTTVNEVGSSISGSGTTTIAGFLALGLSAIPLLRDLGFSLALGIACSLLSAVLINPAMIILEERLEHWYTDKLHLKLSEKKEHHKRKKELDKEHEKNNQ